MQTKQDMLDITTVINYQYYYIKGTFPFVLFADVFPSFFVKIVAITWDIKVIRSKS